MGKDGIDVMVLQDLMTGTDIYLEVIHGDKSFEIPSKTVGAETTGIYIPTFSIGGKTIDFSTKEFSGIVFNLYCIDKRYGNRYCWRSVSLAIRKWQGRDYYLVSSAGFGKTATESDRREDERVILNLSGTILIPTPQAVNREPDPIPVTVLDISNTGVAIHGVNNNLNVGNALRIRFEDEVGEHKFKLAVDVRCVRKAPMNNGFFYGCTVLEGNKEWLTYVFLKKLRQKTQVKA